MNLATSMNWLVTATVKGSLLLLLVGVVLWLTREHVPARWRHALLLIALIRLAMPVAPASSFSLFNAARLWTPAPVAMLSTGVHYRILPGTAISATPQAGPTAPTRTVVLERWLMGIWAAGAMLFLLRTLIALVRVRRLVARSPRVTDSEMVALLARCKAAVGVRQQVVLVEASFVTTPALHGLFAPALLLPPGFIRSFGAEQLEHVFLHELAHLRRLDVPVNLLMTLVQSVHWFNPLVRIASVRMREECELACDAIALSHLQVEETPRYGETILQLLEQLQVPAPLPGVLAMTSEKAQMKRRIQMIAGFKKSSGYTIAFAALVAAVGIVSLTDARAGENKVFVRHMKHQDEAMARTFEQRLDLKLDGASLQDVVNAVENKTGSHISIDQTVATDSAFAARVTLDAKQIPAHVLLMETLTPLGLALDFGEQGAVITKLPDMDAPGNWSPGDGRHMVMIRKRVIKDGAESSDEAMAKAKVEAEIAARSELGGELPPDAHRIEVRVNQDTPVESSKTDGVIKRNVTVTADGIEGTIRLEIQKAPASR